MKDQNPITTSTSEQPSISGGGNRLAAIKRNQMRDRIIEAFEIWDAGGRGNFPDILSTTLFKFAVSKLQEHELVDSQFSGTPTAETAEDAAQEAMIAFWRYKGTFKGATGAQFYAWAHRIIFRKKGNFKSKLISAQQNRIPFEVEAEDDEGELYARENPKIWAEFVPAKGKRVHEKDPILHVFGHPLLKDPKYSVEADIVVALATGGWPLAEYNLGMTRAAMEKRLRRFKVKVEERETAKAERMRVQIEQVRLASQRRFTKKAAGPIEYIQ